MATGQLSCVSEQQKHSSTLRKPLEEIQNLVYLADWGVGVGRAGGGGVVIIIIITIKTFTF